MKLHPKDAPNSVIKGRHVDRLKQTMYFIWKNKKEADKVLSIGDASVFDATLFDTLFRFSDSFCCTKGDLDQQGWKPYLLKKHDVVFCFEVMEHLCNPLLFLRVMKKWLTPDAIIFISIPNHLLRRHWRTLHYHEIDPVRFEYLCEQAGYEIVDRVCHKYYPKLRDITGIRPFIRYITGYSWFISRTDRYFYAIKNK